MDKYLSKSIVFVMALGLLVMCAESAEARRGPVPPGKIDSYNGNVATDQPGSSTWKTQYVPASETGNFSKYKPYPVYDGYLRATKASYKAPAYQSSRGMEVTPLRSSNPWTPKPNAVAEQNWKTLDSSWSSNANYSYPMTAQKEINGIKPDKHFKPSGKLAYSGYREKGPAGDTPIDYLADAATTAEKIISVPFKS